MTDLRDDPDIRAALAAPPVPSSLAVAASEQRFHVFDHSLTHPIRRIDDLAHHFAIAIDDVGVRKFEGAVIGADFNIRVARGLEGYRDAGEEIAVCFFVLVRADAEYHHSGIGESALELIERWKLVEARRPPGCPEVQHPPHSPQNSDE